MAKRPTLADVAGRAGVSKTAVSLVLNDRPGSRLSADAVRRIRAAAEELKYRPNPAARSLRVGKTSTIGFVSDEVTITRFASAMIRGILDVADERDQGSAHRRDRKHPKQMTKAMEACRPPGRRAHLRRALCATGRLAPATRRPAGVTVNFVNPACPSPSSRPEERRGGGDEDVSRGGSRRRHRDHRRLPRSPASDPSISVTIGRRFRRIHACARPRSGADPSRSPIRNVGAVARLRGHEERIGVRRASLRAALPQRPSRIRSTPGPGGEGTRIPDDVSIASFDDDEIASYLRPGLTTARLPMRRWAGTPWK